MNIASTKTGSSGSTSAKTADLTVVGGAGHVGIPLVLAFAEAGLTVNVNDLNEAGPGDAELRQVAVHRAWWRAIAARALARQAPAVHLRSVRNLGRSGPVIITIGTPVDEFLNPVRRDVQRCIDALLPHLADDQLLVLRSTVFPGTTEWLDSYLERKGASAKVAFCPERVVQGNGIKELQEMPQIISATQRGGRAGSGAAVCAHRAGAGHRGAARSRIRQAVQQRLPLHRIRRHQPILHDREIGGRSTISRIMHAMKHNYPRAREHPEPGLCGRAVLFKDTMQLAAFARNQFGLGHAAMQVNEGLVLQLVDDLDAPYDIAQMTVGLLGMAFKAEIDDTRASFSYKLKHAPCKIRAREVLTTDPFVTTDPISCRSTRWSRAAIS